MVVRDMACFLTESIESILGQTFAEFEFIIVDFGSADNSKSIAAGYAAKDSRIKLHEIPNCGLAEARNAGCSFAQGRWIAVMDADDVSLPNRLLWEMEFMGKHPEVGLLGGATEWIDATGRPIRTNFFPTGHDEIKAFLAIGFPFCHSAVLMRREAFATVGGYRAAFTSSQDYDLGLRIAEHFPCANLDRVVLQYRIHPSQISMRMRQQQTLSKLAAQVSASSRRRGDPDPMDAVEEITPELLATLGVTEARLHRELASDCRDWVHNMFLAGEYPVALNAALEFLQSDLKCVERRQLADLRVFVARLYWKQKRFLSSFRAALHAVVTSPVVTGGFLKSLLRRLGLI
jgi:glycosyltransferase involved in cell wall biosynthesis